MDLKLPKLGEGADSGIVVNIMVKEGDSVAKDQTVLELENEKAVASIPSTAAGVVTRIHIKAGDRIAVGQRILTLETAGGQASAPAPSAPAKSAAKAHTPMAPAKPAAPVIQDDPQNAQETTDDLAPEEAVDNANVAASPSIRKMANELGINLGRIRGSASGGRIVIEDVRAYIQRLMRQAARPAAAAAPSAPARPVAESIDFSQWGPILKKPLSPLRKVISRRMSESWQSVVRVTQFDDMDFSRVNELRQKCAPDYQKKGVKLTVTPFVLKAVAATLKQHPIFNSSLDEAAGEIILKEYIHLGIAVDTEQGLLVPVIRDVDKKSMLVLAGELEALAARARDRKVTAEEMKGGTFTISNQGAIGGAHFTPVVNLPEVAILGLGRGAMKPVVREGRIEARLMTPMALSYDHRAIDGGSAARFTVDLVKAFEQFNEEMVKL